MAEQKSLLTRWKEHPTRRQEFLALLREPAMQDALSIVREQIFSPRPMQIGTPDLIAYRALLAEKREGYLEMFQNFLSLADISPFKYPERKPWQTPDMAAAVEKARQELGPEPKPPGTASPEQPQQPQPPQ